MRSRAVLAATGSVVLACLGAGLLVGGSPQLGAALAITAVSLLLWSCLLNLKRLEWLERTHYRSMRDRLASIDEGTQTHARGSQRATTRSAGLIGRSAAVSPVDIPREELIAEVLGAVRPGGRPVVAAIVTSPLWEALRNVADVVEVRPCLAADTVAAVRPSAFVIEEAALHVGLWHGVESSAGLGLLSELDAALAWCGEHAIPVLGVPAAEVGGVSTPLIRRRFALTFPTDTDLRPEGVPTQPMLEVLQEYAARVAHGRAVGA
jgi:hypothetical protein